MRSREQYIAEIERILGDPIPGDGRIETSFQSSTPVEARDLSKRLGLIQKQLRMLRKEANADVRAIRSGFVAERSNVQAGFWASALGGRGGAARDRKHKREQSKAQEGAAMQGHLSVVAIIDDLLLQIDHAKLQADEYIRDNPAPGGAPKVARATDPAAAIRALKQLLDDGLITEEEFASKRAEILARM